MVVFTSNGFGYTSHCAAMKIWYDRVALEIASIVLTKHLMGLDCTGSKSRKESHTFSKAWVRVRGGSTGIAGKATLQWRLRQQVMPHAHWYQRLSVTAYGYTVHQCINDTTVMVYQLYFFYLLFTRAQNKAKSKCVKRFVSKLFWNYVFYAAYAVILT